LRPSELDNMKAPESGSRDPGASGCALGAGAAGVDGHAGLPVDLPLPSAEFQTAVPTGESPDAVAYCRDRRELVVIRGNLNTLLFFKVDRERSDVIKPDGSLGGPGYAPLQFKFALPGAAAAVGVSAKVVYTKKGDLESESEATPRRHLLVADTGNDRVQEIDTDTRTFVGFLIHRTSPFKAPTAVASNAAYIAVSTQVSHYHAAVTLSCVHCGNVSSVAPPAPPSGHANQILLFSATYRAGTTQRPLLWCVDGVASGAPRGLSLPLSARLTADGRYVAVGDHGNEGIVLLSVVDGSFVREVPMRTPAIKPWDIEECAAGWLVVTGATCSSVTLVPHDPSVDVVTRGVTGSSALEFRGAKALALAPGLGLAVVESTNHRFQVLK
jgi:hypothetical protein